MPTVMSHHQETFRVLNRKYSLVGILFIILVFITQPLQAAVDPREKAPVKPQKPNVVPTPPKKQPIPIEITADGENRFEAGMAYASGNVMVKYKDDVLYADEVAYDSKHKEITAMGNVRLYSQGHIYRGDQIIYNFENGNLVSSRFLSVVDKLFLKGDEIRTPSHLKRVIRHGYFTTDDNERPGYHLEANTIEVYDDDEVVLKNVIVYAGSVPIFWLPYFTHSLKEDRGGYNFTLGMNHRWGPYIVNNYSILVKPNWTITPHIAYYGRRGPGGGVDSNYQPLHGNTTQFRSFWIHDQGNDIIGNAVRPIMPEERRFDFEYKHSTEITNDLFTTANINVLSDRYVREDFFPSRFQRDRVPDNFADIMYYDPNFTLTLLARSQINNLFEVVERKPELKLEFKRQQIPYTPLSYEGETSVVNFEQQFDRDDPRHGQNFSTVRYDTFHQLLFPRQYFNWLSITPRAGVRGTVYTRSNINNPDPHEQMERFVFNTGVESSFKVSQTWFDAKKESWGIDGVRHVMEPFINVSYIPTPNLEPTEFRGFDRRLPSTVVAPLNFSAFNSIDSIDRTTTLRHGIRNKIQTKRDGSNVDLLNWVVYADLDVVRQPGSLLEPMYPEVYNQLDVNPLPWLTFHLDSATGLQKESFDEYNANLTWQIIPALEASLGGRILKDFPFLDAKGNRLFPNSEYITSGLFYRLNESWKFGSNFAFEAHSGRLQEQRYTVYRDIGAWDISATAVHRDHSAIEDEFLFYMTFTLKAFPEQSLSF